MRWPWRRRSPRNATYSISDPHLIEVFGLGTNDAGVPVSELSALGVSSIYRSVNLIAGTIAGLPLETRRTIDNNMTQRVTSFLDEAPAGPLDGRTPFEWVETVMLHLLLNGNAYLAHVYNAAGGLVGLVPFHPACVSPEWEKTRDGKLTGRKLFNVSVEGDGLRLFTEEQMTHIPALTGDGLRGYSPIWVARNSFGKAIAADRAAARSYSNGAMMSGLVTPDEELEEGDAEKIKKDLQRKALGWENAGEIAVVNRRMKFTPWTMSARDAQFLESRAFEVEEVARWFGLLPIHLAQTEKQTSWGTGIAEQNRGLARYTLMPWTNRIEQRVSRLLARPRYTRFDYTSLLRPSPEQEIPLLISQVDAGLMTTNEARRQLGRDPVDGGDTLRPAQSRADSSAPDPEGVPA